MLKTLFTFILILLIFLSTVGYVAVQLTKPTFLVAQAQKVHLYEQATNQVGSLLPKDAIGNFPLSADDIKTVLTKTIDGTTFYRELGKALTSYSNYLTSQSHQLSYQFNLTPFKTKLVDQLTTQLNADYQALPLCKATDLKTWDATTQFPSCQLPASNVQSKDVTSLLAAQAEQTVGKLPDSWAAPAPSKNLATVRSRVTQILGLIRIAWLLTVGVVALWVIVARRKAFFPLAAIFIVAGLLEVAFGVVAWDWLRHIVIDLISKPGSSQQVVTMITTVVDDSIQALKTILGDISIGTLSIGGLFLILWGFTRFSRPKDRMEIPRS